MAWGKSGGQTTYHGSAKSSSSKTSSTSSSGGSSSSSRTLYRNPTTGKTYTKQVSGATQIVDTSARATYSKSSSGRTAISTGSSRGVSTPRQPTAFDKVYEKARTDPQAIQTENALIGSVSVIRPETYNERVFRESVQGTRQLGLGALQPGQGLEVGSEGNVRLRQDTILPTYGLRSVVQPSTYNKEDRTITKTYDYDLVGTLSETYTQPTKFEAFIGKAGDKLSSANKYISDRTGGVGIGYVEKKLGKNIRELSEGATGISTINPYIKLGTEKLVKPGKSQTRQEFYNMLVFGSSPVNILQETTAGKFEGFYSTVKNKPVTLGIFGGVGAAFGAGGAVIGSAAAGGSAGAAATIKVMNVAGVGLLAYYQSKKTAEAIERGGTPREFGISGGEMIAEEAAFMGGSYLGAKGTTALIRQRQLGKGIEVTGKSKQLIQKDVITQQSKGKIKIGKQEYLFKQTGKLKGEGSYTVKGKGVVSDKKFSYMGKGVKQKGLDIKKDLVTKGTEKLKTKLSGKEGKIKSAIDYETGKVKIVEAKGKNIIKGYTTTGEVKGKTDYIFKTDNKILFDTNKISEISFTSTYSAKPKTITIKPLGKRGSLSIGRSQGGYSSTFDNVGQPQFSTSPSSVSSTIKISGSSVRTGIGSFNLNPSVGVAKELFLTQPFFIVKGAPIINIGSKTNLISNIDLKTQTNVNSVTEGLVSSSNLVDFGSSTGSDYETITDTGTTTKTGRTTYDFTSGGSGFTPPPDVPIPPVFTSVSLIGGGGNAKKFKPKTKIRRMKKYLPSIAGVELGVKKKKGKYLTGLEIRGIPI